MKLRVARPGDAAAVCAVTNAIIGDTLITFTTRERLVDEVASEIAARGRRFLVVEGSGGSDGSDGVVGFATYGPFRSGPGYAHTAEHSIQLAPVARGSGAGRALMTRLFQIAREDEMRVLVAGISGANPDGIAFHSAMGFHEVGRMAQVGFKAGQWLDLVLMQKNLLEG